MWILRLNDMRSPNIEMYEVVAKSESNYRLEQWLQCEKVEPYREDNWGKVYRKGGPLEWYNEPILAFGQGIVNICSEEEYVEDARRRYRELMDRLFLVE